MTLEKVITLRVADIEKRALRILAAETGAINVSEYILATLREYTPVVERARLLASASSQTDQNDTIEQVAERG